MKTIFFILIIASTYHLVHQKDKYSVLRDKMVEEQIIARGISDKKILAALRKVPRHLFVPGNLIDDAYNDSPLPIGYGQTISQPYIVALMTEVSRPGKGMKVLEIGTGSGYQAAVLAEIVDSVFTIEIDENLARISSARLSDLGYGNIISMPGDGYRGWPAHAPFDIIIVTAAPEEIPEPLINQLAENGRMVIPVGGSRTIQDLLLIHKKDGKIVRKKISSVIFVPFRRK